jgi:hypothetical protein
MGPEASDAVPPLLDLLNGFDGSKENDDQSVIAIHHVLENIASGARPVLIEQLNSADTSRRAVASYVLAHIPGRAPNAVPALLEAIKNDDPSVRALVGAALWRAAPEDDRVFATLRKALRNDNELVRAHVVEGIRSCLEITISSGGISPYGGQDQVVFDVPLAPTAMLLAEAAKACVPTAGESGDKPRLDRIPWEFNGLTPGQFSSACVNCEKGIELILERIRLRGQATVIVPQLIEIARFSQRRDLRVAAVYSFNSLDPDSDITDVLKVLSDLGSGSDDDREILEHVKGRFQEQNLVPRLELLRR